MLDAQKLADKLLESANELISLPEFEDWFEAESWNVHRTGDQPLIDAVFQIEALLFRESEGTMEHQSLLHAFRELAAAARPKDNN